MIMIQVRFYLECWFEPYCGNISGCQEKADQEDTRSARQGQVEAGLLGQDVGPCLEVNWAL